MLASYKKVKHQARTYKQKMLIINKVKNDDNNTLTYLVRAATSLIKVDTFYDNALKISLLKRKSSNGNFVLVKTIAGLTLGNIHTVLSLLFEVNWAKTARVEKMEFKYQFPYFGFNRERKRT
ncbi:CLUMA_CG021051, isoform A [Clunio marinus]|uniref:CLUMA_CG021051, isoform A n=1 Tax=Clunio marinus TaxID=568069 RepID=A0A1J1JAI9_9DIPT|nr:CLUMA_CG021051, isoform A [Clunio marinus]